MNTCVHKKACQRMRDLFKAQTGKTANIECGEKCPEYVDGNEGVYSTKLTLKELIEGVIL